MPEVTMVAALNAALRDALKGDPKTLVFGEDVGELGGVFRVTDGLQKDFGRERVFNTPIAEAGIAADDPEVVAMATSAVRSPCVAPRSSARPRCSAA